MLLKKFIHVALGEVALNHVNNQNNEKSVFNFQMNKSTMMYTINLVLVPEMPYNVHPAV